MASQSSNARSLSECCMATLRGWNQIPAVIDETRKRSDPGGQVRASGPEEPARADPFDAKASERCGEKHRGSNGRRVSRGGEIAHETSSERIARPGWVDHIFERIGRDEERTAVVEQQRPEF